jgi:hypothetical protein
MSNQTLYLPLEAASKDASAPRACAEFLAELVRQGVTFQAIGHGAPPSRSPLPAGYGPVLVVNFTGGF